MNASQAPVAHLQTRATRHDPQARYAAKWHLVQLLYQRGWSKQRIIDLFLVIDWMMTLPEHLKQALWQNLNNLEQEKKMAYVSSVERIGIEKGLQAGMQQGMQQGVQQGEALALQKLLAKRFGVVAPAMALHIENADRSQLEAWFDRAIDAPDLATVFDQTTPPKSH